MKKIIFALLALCLVPLFGCQTTRTNPSNPIPAVRQILADLPEPTFQTLEVAVHDYTALGIKSVVKDNPDTRVPLRALADSALSVLQVEVISMIDVTELSKSLDDIKNGIVKPYLQIAWTLLELNGVIRRDDLTANLTQREQRLIIALFKGVQLGTGDSTNVDRVLNARGARY